MNKSDDIICSAEVNISLTVLAHNFTVLQEMCGAHDIEISGVTKGVAGSGQIAHAMLSCGIKTLSDSRLENIRRLRNSGINAPIYLLRSPTQKEITCAVDLCNGIDVSHLVTIKAIDVAAQSAGKIMEVVLMIDMGDLREGVPPSQLFDLVEQVEGLRGVHIVGVATNYSCHIGLLPNSKNLDEFCRLARQTQTQIGRRLKIVSGGNSSSLTSMFKGDFPMEINHLRLGESLLLGRETAMGTQLNNTHDDGCIAAAEIIEIWDRQYDADTPVGMNAFGQKFTPELPKNCRLAVLSIGAMDVEMSGLLPIDKNLRMVGFSSDHAVVDVSTMADLHLGDILKFKVNYAALSRIMASAYVATTIS